MGKMGYPVEDLANSLTEVMEDFSVLGKFNAEISHRLSEGKVSEKDYPQLLIYKLLSEEILKNSFEDDSVDYKSLREVISLLGKSYSNIDKPEVWKKYLIEFGSAYRKLLKTKKHKRTDMIQGYPIYIYEKRSTGGSILLTSSTENLKFFPDMDLIFSDPEAAKRASQEYLSKINDLKKEKRIDRLCFIEKRKGSIGSLTLQPFLTSKTKIPSVIIRASYIDNFSKIKGMYPDVGNKVTLIYDLLNFGNGIAEAAEILKERYLCNLTDAIVFFDYEREGSKERLRDEYNIEVHPLHTLSEFNSAYKRGKEMMKRIKKHMEKIEKELKELRKQKGLISEDVYEKKLADISISGLGPNRR